MSPKKSTLATGIHSSDRAVVTDQQNDKNSYGYRAGRRCLEQDALIRDSPGVSRCREPENCHEALNRRPDLVDIDPAYLCNEIFPAYVGAIGALKSASIRRLNDFPSFLAKPAAAIVSAVEDLEDTLSIALLSYAPLKCEKKLQTHE